MANSADPDQLASSEANWSGSTLFAKQGISGQPYPVPLKTQFRLSGSVVMIFHDEKRLEAAVSEFSRQQNWLSYVFLRK